MCAAATDATSAVISPAGAAVLHKGPLPRTHKQSTGGRAQLPSKSSTCQSLARLGRWLGPPVKKGVVFEAAKLGPHMRAEATAENN